MRLGRLGRILRAADLPGMVLRLEERRVRHRRRRPIYRLLVALAGLGVLIAGLAMLVLPGPGLLVTAVGLAILALEFAWAEQLLSRAAVRLESLRSSGSRRRRRR